MTTQLSMYTASVPVFSRYLDQLAKLLVLAEAHIARHQLDPKAVLEAGLAPSMLPFAVQVEIAANFALRACAPLAGRDVPPLREHRDSLSSLQRHIASTRAFLATLTPADMDGREGQQFTSKAGQAMLSLEGPAFLTQYALPNFFFHTTTAFAILRHIGVEIGKADFDGFHLY